MIAEKVCGSCIVVLGSNPGAEIDWLVRLGTRGERLISAGWRRDKVGWLNQMLAWQIWMRLDAKAAGA